MRARGKGSIQKTEDGRFRPRMPGSRIWLDAQPTYAEAEQLLNRAIEIVVRGPRDAERGLTLAEFGADFLRDRRIEGRVRDVTSEVSRFDTHIKHSAIGRMRIRIINETHVREWLAELLKKNAERGHNHKTLRRRKVGRATTGNTLTLLRAIFEAARIARTIKTNPARDVKLPRAEGRTHEPWSYLPPREQELLLTCEAIPRNDRLVIQFAIGSGMRQGEVWALRRADVHLDEAAPHVVVRYGGQKGATKGGKLRRVPLFGLALKALREWLPVLAMLPARRNTLGLVFPSRLGTVRGKKPIARWEEYLALAGLAPGQRHDGRALRWHDLRHTCASSLVAGWWGRRWSLEEVRGLLGHSTIAMTERYAHLADTALAQAARETDGG